MQELGLQPGVQTTNPPTFAPTNPPTFAPATPPPTAAPDTRPPSSIPCAVSPTADGLTGFGGIEVTVNGLTSFVAAGKSATVYTCNFDTNLVLELRSFVIDKEAAAAARATTSVDMQILSSWSTPVSTSAGVYRVRAIPQNSCVNFGCTVNSWAVQGNNAVLQGFSPGGKACYCDDACTQFRDCCVDYQSTCGVFTF
jgi:hypothetical protein